MQQNQNLEFNEKLIIENRKHLLMTGVISVDGFSERVISLSLTGGKAQIIGENMKISAFNKANGNLSAEGLFNEIKYNQKKQPIIRRIFK